MFPSLEQDRQLRAWSWGISRLIDGIAQVKDQLNVDIDQDRRRTAVLTPGKMALFGGAFDERVALTSPRNRVVAASTPGAVARLRDRTGTQIEKIDNTNYSLVPAQHAAPQPVQAAPRSS